VTEATNWLGAPAGPCDIHGWSATRFDVKGTLGLALRRKGNRRTELTFQEYFGKPLPVHACLPELRAEFDSRGAFNMLEREPSKTSVWTESTESFAGLGFDALPDHHGGGGAAAAAHDFFLLDAEDTASVHSEVLTGLWPEGTQQQQDGDRRECAVARGQPSVQRQSRSSRGSKPKQQEANASKQSTSSQHAAVSSKGARLRDQTGKTTRAVSASVWFSDDFPMPLQQFLPILEALAAEHEAMRSLQQLLAAECLQRAARRVTDDLPGGGDASSSKQRRAKTGHVFPIRASVPLNLALRATVHVEACTLVDPGTLSDDLFEVPADYKLVPRREAQKTPNRAKKRMLLANLIM